jgi:hypothetical protein
MRNSRGRATLPTSSVRRAQPVKLAGRYRTSTGRQMPFSVVWLLTAAASALVTFVVCLIIIFVWEVL